MNVISRKQAKHEGRKFYFTGKPCPLGHVSKRRVSTRACTGCQHAKDTARYHRDRVREQNRSRERGRRKLPAPTRPCPERCELCGSPPGKRALHLDHDHLTNQFRGWLCHMCNLSLGKFGDGAAGLRRALNYLESKSLSGVPTEAKARKALPIASGVLDYFPESLLAVAEVSRIGNEQHNPGQPLHWAKEKSTDEADALLRHLIDRGKRDSDGSRHSAKVAWRALALLQRELDAEK